MRTGTDTEKPLLIPRKALACALAPLLAAAVAACGSTATRTVTVTRTVPASATAPARSTATSTSSAAASTTTATSTSVSHTSSTAAVTSTTASSTAATSTSSTRTTRTETEPAFVGTNPSSAGALGHDLAAAVAVLAHAGYTPVSLRSYGGGDTLRVLVGSRAGVGEHAFFFDGTIYLGTDASAPSEQITVIAHSDTEVVLGYATYRAGASAPSGVRAVHFALDMGMLSAIDALPPVSLRR